MRQRFAILWAALKNVFTGRGVILTTGVEVHVASEGLHVAHWIQRAEGNWQHVALSFDYMSPPKGYVNSLLIVDVAANKTERRTQVLQVALESAHKELIRCIADPEVVRSVTLALRSE